MIESTRYSSSNFRRIMPFVTAADDHDGYIKCISNGFMPLVIEKLYYSDCYGNPVYSFAHYGIQNGDAMRDPEVTFSIDRERREIIPATYENSYMGTYQRVFQEIGGRLMYSSSLLRELDHFLHQWLNNIESQGFSPDVIDE